MGRKHDEASGRIDSERPGKKTATARGRALLIALGALALANIVAAVPGRIAAHTPTALLLRAE